MNPFGFLLRWLDRRIERIVRAQIGPVEETQINLCSKIELVSSIADHAYDSVEAIIHRELSAEPLR